MNFEPMMAWPYLAKSAARESGMPSRSVMTTIGSGAAKLETRSNRPAAAASSSSPTAVRSIRVV